MTRTPRDERQDLPHDRLHVFVLGSFFLGLGLFGLMIGFGPTRESLRACCSSESHTFVAFLHWLNLTAGLGYIVMFCTWWARCKRPWNQPNPVSFSRQAWSGREAWRLAVQDRLSAWRAGDLPAVRRRAWIANAAAISAVIASSAVLIGLLMLCDHCPTGLDGKCTESIGSIAGSAFVMLIYYDMRIKFSGRP